MLDLIKKNIRKLFKSPIEGENNKIANNGTFVNVDLSIVGNNNFIEIKEGAVLSNVLIVIKGNGHKLIVEENCQIKGGAICFEDNNCVINVGKKTTIESAEIAVTEPNKKIIIGEDCMFSYSIELRTGDSHSIIDNISGKRINEAQDIIIGNHVWIGAHSIILKGVSIGNNSIIGTGSVVTKSIGDNSIAVGVPAKIVKNDINWKRERIYN